MSDTNSTDLEAYDPSEPALSDRDPSDPGTTTLNRLKNMDNPAWSKLVEQHFARVHQWCLDSGMDDHTAADISQEVFVSALGSLHRFNKSSQSTFGGWLRTICKRRIADYWRRRREIPQGGTDALQMFSQLESIRNSLEPNNHPQTLDDEQLLAAVAIIQTEFESLSWRAFWMVTVEGRSAVDVAFELGMTRNAVYLAKSRILKRMRDALTQRE
jgi:RNA polymerase sigma-70 factor (ECF subfamily)